MRKILIVLGLITLFSENAFAVTLYDALNQTYKNNTQLNAERENIKASEEDINISEADYRPSLTLSGSKSFENTHKLTKQSGGDASVTDVDPLTSSIKLSLMAALKELVSPLPIFLKAISKNSVKSPFSITKEPSAYASPKYKSGNRSNL